MTKENIIERVKGGGVSTAPSISKVGTGGSGGRNNPTTKLNPGKVTPQSQIRKIDPAPFNRSAASVTSTPSGDNLKSGSFGISKAGRDQAAQNRAEFKAKVDAVKSSSNTSSSSSMSARDKFKSKFIKKDKGVGFVKRGTPGAQRAENIEKNRMRAKQMAKDRIARKKEAEVKSKSQSNSGSSETMMASYTPDMDAYDMVLEYLLSTEQAATIEEANYVMMQLDEENIQEIVGSVAKLITKTPLVKLVPAAAATVFGIKKGAELLGKKSGENQIKNSTPMPTKKSDPIKDLIPNIKKRNKALEDAIEKS